jgi:WD40 repeat protein
LEGGSRYALITTRQKQVISIIEDRWEIKVFSREIKGLLPEEAITFFWKGRTDDPPQQKERTTVKRLVKLLHYWPLLLTLARSLLISLLKKHHDMEEALRIIEQAYKRQGVVAYDRYEQTIKKCLETSLRHLEGDLTSYHPVDRYQELAIFPVGTDIPLATLQKFWEITGGLREETTILCVHLEELSLLQTYTSGAEGVVRLHHAMHDFLWTRTDAAMLQRLHQQLLDAYACQRWAQLPLDEPYLWRYLCWHLLGAGRSEMLVATVKDGSYLATKIRVCTVSAVEADIEEAIKRAGNDTSLRLLKSQLTRISHLLHRCKSLDDVRNVLHSRLSPLPGLQETCRTLEEGASRPLLTSWRAFPDLADPALKRTLARHTKRVKGCAIDPAGAFIVSASADCTLKLWSAKTGDEEQTLTGHTAEAQGCAVDSQGERVVSASSDGTLKIWELATGNPWGTLVGHSASVNACTFGAHGQRVVSASSDGTLKIWDVVTCKEEQTLSAHRGQVVYGCALDPETHWVVSASSDGMLDLWEVGAGSSQETLRGHDGDVYSCTFDTSGQLMVSASSDGTLKVWDARTRETLHVLQGHTGKVFACAISPDGKRIVSASDDWTLKIWDAQTGETLRTLQDHTGEVLACAISPDGKWIVSASADTTLKMWSMDIEEEESRTATSYKGTVLHCAVCPVSDEVIVSRSDISHLTVYHAESGNEHPTGGTPPLDGVNGCAVSPDGTWVVSACSDHMLKIWERQTGSSRRGLRGPTKLEGHTDNVNACAISPDGTWIVSASDDTTLKIWETQTGQLLRTLRGHSGWVRACAISPDGTWIVSASDDTTLKVWEVQTGQLLHTLEEHSGRVNACAISPDGTWIVSASDDTTLKVWEVQTGQLLHTLEEHSGRVNACAISLDGLWIVSASDDCTLKVWDARGKRERPATLYVDNTLRTCAFFFDSEHLVAGGPGGLYSLRLLR